MPEARFSAFRLRSALDRPVIVTFDPWQVQFTIQPGGVFELAQQMPTGVAGFFEIDMTAEQGLWVFGWPEGEASLTVNGKTSRLQPRPGPTRPVTWPPGWPGEEWAADATVLNLTDSRGSETRLVSGTADATSARYFWIATRPHLEERPLVEVYADRFILTCSELDVSGVTSE